MGYVLKFISGKYQGGEFPLPMETEITIGRASDLEMVLAEEMVSRRHSKIITKNAKIVLQDLGSTNGTFVNGERVTIYPLKEGDRVLIGTSIFKLVETDRIDGASFDRKDIRDRLRRIADHKKTITKTFAERIEEIPIIDILQLYQTTKRTGSLIVQSDRTGKIFLREGNIISACIDDDFSVNPYKALYRCLTWTHGTYRLTPLSKTDFPVEITEDSESVLAEGKRQMEEITKLPQRLPLDMGLKLAVPLRAHLRELTGDYLDTLELVINHGRVEDILNHSEAADYETYLDLLYLLEYEYIVIV